MSDAVVTPVSVRDDGVGAFIDALTAELADGGYTDEETFGYSAEQLEQSGVHLVGARLGGVLVGIGGVEVQDDGCAPSSSACTSTRAVVAAVSPTR